MHVECDIDGIDPQPVLLKFFEKVLKYAAGRMSFDLGTVGRVIVASPDRFGRAVNAIAAGATHTNTEWAVAGGKTIPRSEGGSVVSDIVLRCSFFEDLAAVLADPPPSTTWGIDQQQALYVICHEFGHAQDHRLRNDASQVPDPRSHPFSIAAYADYCGSIVLTEFAASCNSASVMTDLLFYHNVQEAGNRMTSWARQVRHYLDRPADYSPDTRARVACEGAWVNMVELARLYGSAFRRPDHEEDIRALEAEILTGSPLGDALARWSTVYPCWDVPGLIAVLIPIWRRYGALSSVRFVTRNEADEMEDMAQGD